jgi:hypothetical protein
MSLSHSNKGGARYRYYISQAVLQRKPLAAGAIGRVPAAEIEVLISAALRPDAGRYRRVPARPYNRLPPQLHAQCHPRSRHRPSLAIAQVHLLYELDGRARPRIAL